MTKEQNRVELNDGVFLNPKLRYECWRKKGVREKDGVWDVTVFPNGLYCFPLKRFLGINGRIDDHPFIGRKFYDKEKRRVLECDGVCVHYMKGYYYMMTLKDEHNSHSAPMFENINSVYDLVIDAVEEFKQRYELIEE